MDAHASPPTGVRTLLFDADGSDRRLPLEQVQLPRLSPRQLAWIDVLGGRDELASVQRQLGLDPLPAMSLLDTDAPPVFSQKDWFGARALAPRWDADHATCHGEPWLLVVGPNTVLTVHKQALPFLDELYTHEDPSSRVGALDADSFAASLLDRMLTSVFDAIDSFEDRLDALEMQILEPSVRPGQLGQLRQLRHAVSMLRRLLSAHRSLFDALSRPDFMPEQSRAVEAQFQAVSARYERAMDAVENARDLVVGSFELLATRLSQRTNESVHGLTFYTVLLGSLAVVAGILGMNFQAALFDSGTRGFWITVAAMALVVTVALAYAHRRGWWR